MGSPRSRNAAGRKPDNHEDWRKRYKAPASGDKPEGTDKRPLLCSSFSSSRVPDPCPRCPQTPWNQRTEDTGSDAELSCRQDDFPPEKPHKGPIHEHPLRFPAGQDNPRRTRRAGGGVSSALPRRHSHAGTTQGSHVLQPPRGRQAPPSGAVPVHRRPVRPERRSGDALRRLAGNDPHVLPHPRRSARDG